MDDFMIENADNIELMFMKNDGYIWEYMFYFDLNRDYYCISNAVIQGLDLSAERFCGSISDFLSYVHEEDYNYICNEFKRIKNEKGKLHKLEYRMVSHKGADFWIKLTGELINMKEYEEHIFTGKMQLQEKDRPMNLKLKGEKELENDLSVIRYKNVRENAVLVKAEINEWCDIKNKFGISLCRKIFKFYCREVLNSFLGKKFSIYEIGDGNFYILILLDISKKYFRQMVSKLNDSKTLSYNEKGIMCYYSISAGCRIFSCSNCNYESLIQETEYAYYCASKGNGTRVGLFDSTKYDKYLRKINITEQLKYDVSNGFQNFEVYYQPIVSAISQNVSGAEALLRWHCEKYGIVPPIEFIPILEETGLIVPVGKWVLHTALVQCKNWQERIPHFRMNVNLSYIQLKQSDVLGDLVKSLEVTNLDSRYIMLEITESGRVEKDFAVRHMMKHLQKMKVKLAIDDFGTGYSNFSYLMDLKVHIIKIDRSFVVNSLANHYQFTLLQHIIQMAHEVQLKVCMEGIENEEELQKLLKLEPDFIQGYYFGKPTDADTFLTKYIS